MTQVGYLSAIAHAHSRLKQPGFWPISDAALWYRSRHRICCGSTVQQQPRHAGRVSTRSLPDPHLRPPTKSKHQAAPRRSGRRVAYVRKGAVIVKSSGAGRSCNPIFPNRANWS